MPSQSAAAHNCWYVTGSMNDTLNGHMTNLTITDDYQEIARPSQILIRHEEPLESLDGGERTCESQFGPAPAVPK